MCLYLQIMSILNGNCFILFPFNRLLWNRHRIARPSSFYCHFLMSESWYLAKSRPSENVCWMNKRQPCRICFLRRYILPQVKEIAPHTSTLAWKIPWMKEPGELWSMGSLRVGYDWAASLSLFTFMHWRRKWQPTPVFLPGESRGRGSLVGFHLWGRTESDTTEAT